MERDVICKLFLTERDVIEEFRRSTARMPRLSDLLENNMRFQRESWKMRASRILRPGCAVHGSDNEWEDAPYGYMGWLGN